MGLLSAGNVQGEGRDVDEPGGEFRRKVRFLSSPLTTFNCY
jgi:hypothetical protein